MQIPTLPSRPGQQDHQGGTEKPFYKPPRRFPCAMKAQNHDPLPYTAHAPIQWYTQYTVKAI
jgi:hypothetical protein